LISRKPRSRWSKLERKVSADDPLTRGYALRFRAWSALSDRTALAVLSEGQHYFVGTRPELVVDVVCKHLGDREALWQASE
jgi:hypothetical protein